MKTDRIRHTIVYLLLILFAAVALFPVYWMLNTSLKNPGEIYFAEPTLFPKKPILNSYAKMLSNNNFMRSITNSLFVGLAVAALTIIVCTLLAYAVARINFKGRKFISVGILYCYLIPKTILFIPLYIFVSNIGLINNLLGLIVIYPTFTIPYAAWILIPYIKSISYSIEEAAVIDGCSRLQVIRRIVFPLAMPGIISTAIFTFTMCWGEYLYALLIINKTSIKTFPLMLTELIEADVFAWGPLMASAVIVSVPVVALYMIGSKYIVNDASAGAVKQ